MSKRFHEAFRHFDEQIKRCDSLGLSRLSADAMSIALVGAVLQMCGLSLNCFCDEVVRVVKLNEAIGVSRLKD